MKIVMNEAGEVIGRHIDAATIDAGMYREWGSVLVGIVPDSKLRQDNIGRDILTGSAIDAARDLARQMTREEVAGMLDDLREDYPQEERDTWPSKVIEANAILAGGSVGDTIYIAAVAEATGSKPEAIAKSVIKKAKVYAAKVAEAEAFRSARYVAIDGAKNIEAVIAAVGG
jgi:hypothetical protein